MSIADTDVDLDDPKTLEEVAAEEAKLNYWWLRRMCARREIEFTKVGRNYCLTRAQVAAAKQRRFEKQETALDDDITRERERRASGPRRRRPVRAA